MKQQMNLDVDSETSKAQFSKCQRYRTMIQQIWGEGKGFHNARLVLWIMLNPSTADHRDLDPTLRRCMSFSKAWGYDGMTICNLFALRATDPRELLTATDRVGPRNNEAILRAAMEAERIVVAWGAHSTAVQRANAVVKALTLFGPLYCLGTTKSGAPKHPLYVKGGTELEEFNGR
jgi:hypothetical protein